MKIPVVYNLRSLRQRPVSTLTTALGMALVVGVFVAMMALSNGFRAALINTGSADNVMLLRTGANQEMYSGIGRPTVSIVNGMPFVATGEDGRPLVSPETFVVIPLQRVGNAGLANVVARGVSPLAFDVRKDVEIVEGRIFRSGSREVVIGASLTRRLPNTAIGDQIEFGGQPWTVVGHFSANGSSFESEIWGENEQFMPVFRGEVFQSITFRMRDPSAYGTIEETLESDSRLAVDAYKEDAYYASQSTALATVLNFFAVFVAGVMGIGAVFGAINTMYAAVATRAPEIGVLLTLGFKPRNVLSSFLVEAIFISLLGGLLGCLLVLPINGLVTSTTNWNTFSEVAFAFRITPQLLVTGLIFAVIMGILGGFFPARRAAKSRIIDALKEA